MNLDVRQQVERMLDQAAGRHPDGVKADELRREVFDDTVKLLAKTKRDLTAEAEALLVSVGQRSRKSRRDRMGHDIEYILDAFAEDESGAYIDPLLDLAYPIGTDDGQVKTLRNWTTEDFDTSTRMAYRKAAEITASAREHDEAMQAAVRSMRMRGTTRFGSSTAASDAA